MFLCGIFWFANLSLMKPPVNCKYIHVRFGKLHSESQKTISLAPNLLTLRKKKFNRAFHNMLEQSFPDSGASGWWAGGLKNYEYERKRLYESTLKKGREVKRLGVTQILYLSTLMTNSILSNILTELLITSKIKTQKQDRMFSILDKLFF